MFSKATVISILVGVATAQVPSGVSSQCSSFLTKLDSDTSLKSCSKDLWDAVSSFDPAASSVSESLDTFCSGSTSCAQETIRATLASFYSSCPDELAGGTNQAVTLIYDTIYAMIPYKEALCSKGDNSVLCATSGTPSNTIPLVDGGSMTSQEVLENIGSDAPNATVFASTNMLFMFLTPTTPSAQLCTSCTRNIMSAYMSFESSISYGPGFASSILLAGQSSLYSAIESTCGANFLSGQLQAAGSLSDSGTINTNGATHGKMLSGSLVALAAALSLISTL